jgi:hypothetical protein
MELVIASKHIEDKLTARNITISDLLECFALKSGKVLIDDREKNRTDPPTLWFISQTQTGRALKVVFIYFADVKQAHVKSAYEPNSIELEIYEKLK